MTTTKKAAALLSSSALAAGAAHGAVLYEPVNCTFTTDQKLTLDLNEDGFPDYIMTFGGASKPSITSTNTGTATSFVLSASSNQGLPLTTIGTAINGSYQSAQTAGYFNKNTSGTVVGSWTAAGNVEGYVGLQLTDGAGPHYAWAHFIYNATNKPTNDVNTGTLTLVDAAIEANVNTAILAGQTAETGDMPAIVLPPLSQSNYLGGTALLTVTATGFPTPTFQWRAGAVGSGIYTNLPNGAGTTDGAVNTLALHDLTLANTADYVVVVSNASGVVTSSVPATLSVLSSSDNPATLLHRYSFQDAPGSSTFADSVGGPSWAGTPMGTAALTGSGLALDGTSGCYGLLPSGLISGFTQMTVEFWVDIGNNPNYTRIFFFGDQTGGGSKNTGIDYAPSENGGPNGYQNLDLVTTGGGHAFVNTSNSVPINNTVNDHITVIVDTVGGVMWYYNGTNVVSMLNTNTPIPSLANINDVVNMIGASPFSTDPYLKGTIHEFRVYAGVLSPQAITLNDAVGLANYIQLAADPTVSTSVSGGNLVLSWPGSDYNFSVQSKANVSNGTAWTTLTNKPAMVGTNWQVSIPVPATTAFFQLVHN